MPATQPSSSARFWAKDDCRTGLANLTVGAFRASNQILLRNRKGDTAQRPPRPWSGLGAGRKTMSARILVIDPDAPILDVARQSLTLEGYAVATVCNGLAGLRCIREFTPALVLTEILMPDKDGIECLLEIKRNHPDTKVVAMSGGNGTLKSAFVLHLAAKLGADGVLAKPFTQHHLSCAVRAALASVPIPVTAGPKP